MTNYFTAVNSPLELSLLSAFLFAVRFLSLVRVLSGDSRRTSPFLLPDLCLASIVRLSGLDPTTEHRTSVLVLLTSVSVQLTSVLVLSTSVLVLSTSVPVQLTSVLLLLTSVFVLLTSVLLLLTSVLVL